MVCEPPPRILWFFSIYAILTAYPRMVGRIDGCVPFRRINMRMENIIEKLIQEIEIDASVENLPVLTNEFSKAFVIFTSRFSTSRVAVIKSIVARALSQLRRKADGSSGFADFFTIPTFRRQNEDPRLQKHGRATARRTKSAWKTCAETIKKALNCVAPTSPSGLKSRSRIRLSQKNTRFRSLTFQEH